MTLCLSAPSKTFLAGEYAVLAGVPALIVNSEPRFELRVKFGTGKTQGIPRKSPAHLWLEQRAPLLSAYDLDFVDPHQGRGGFGASGAQFLLVHTLTSFLQLGFSEYVKGVRLNELWNDLQVLSQRSGSGADVLAQCVGGIARVVTKTQEARVLSWPYPQIDFAVLRTDQKINTHEHLQSLPQDCLQRLSPAAAACVESFGSQDESIFCQRLRVFANTLRDLGLQSPRALQLLAHIEDQPWCLAAKGCGAMGADTVMFLYPVSKRGEVKEFLAANNLKSEADVNHLSSGLRMEWSSDAN